MGIVTHPNNMRQRIGIISKRLAQYTKEEKHIYMTGVIDATPEIHDMSEDDIDFYNALMGLLADSGLTEEADRLHQRLQPNGDGCFLVSPEVQRLTDKLYKADRLSQTGD